MKIKHGCTRLVFLTKNYAIKVPQIHYEWKHFLLGLLTNMNEVSAWKNAQKKNENCFILYSRLCPICFYIPYGFLVVMKRANILSRKQFYNLDVNEFKTISDTYIIPVEDKLDSFGLLNNKIVAVDYGTTKD